MPCEQCPHCLANGYKKTDNRNPSVQALWDAGMEVKFNSSNQAKQRWAINRLLKKYPIEQLKLAILYASKIREDNFAPKIYNFLDLEQRWEKLVEHKKKFAPNKPSKGQDDSPQITGFKDIRDENGKVIAKEPIYG